MRRPSQEGQAHVRSPINPAGVAHYNVPLHDSARPSPPGPRGPAASLQPGQPPCLRHELIQHAACEEVAGQRSRQQGDNVPIKTVSPSPIHPAPLSQDHPTPGPAQPPVLVGVPCGSGLSSESGHRKST